MNEKLAKRIKEIALELVAQKSIVETRDEITMSDKVYEVMGRIDYFKKHPENLYFVPVKNDPWDRKIVVAILNGEKKPSKKTVIYIGHTDTVGISDYGKFQDLATKPEELLEALKTVTSLSDEVKADIATGRYMFGRGIFDMKSGDANIIGIMEEVANDIENFEGNIIYAAVCDEEGNSKGMLTFVPELVRLREKYGYEYRAMLDPDYIAPAFPGDKNTYLYIGTVGKLMPTFLVCGKETHVGESFDGLDPNQIAAEITRRVNLNPEFSDVVEGEVTLPPITLKQRDLKPEYSVQIASQSVLFFNYATHSSTPAEVMDKMMKAGAECFQAVIDTLNERYEKFCGMVGREFKKLPWKERTISYDQLFEMVKKEVPDLEEQVKKYAEEVSKDPRYDVRDQALKIVQFVHSLWSDKNPALIVYLTPPYYPHIFVEGKRDDERDLIDAVANAIKTTETDYTLVQKKFLPCISDLSYAAAPKEAEAMDALRLNMPGFGTIYDLPIEDMQALDLPVADIGSYGKDAHKFTERVDTVYSYEVLPEILKKTMNYILEK